MSQIADMAGVIADRVRAHPVAQAELIIQMGVGMIEAAEYEPSMVVWALERVRDEVGSRLPTEWAKTAINQILDQEIARVMAELDLA